MFYFYFTNEISIPTFFFQTSLQIRKKKTQGHVLPLNEVSACLIQSIKTWLYSGYNNNKYVQKTQFEHGVQKNLLCYIKSCYMSLIMRVHCINLSNFNIISLFSTCYSTFGYKMKQYSCLNTYKIYLPYNRYMLIQQNIWGNNIFSTNIVFY